MAMKPLAAWQAGNELRVLYVLAGGVVPPPPVIPCREEFMPLAKGALSAIALGQNAGTLALLDPAVRACVQAALAGFIEACDAEPATIIAHLPPDAAASDRLRAAIEYVLLLR